MSMPSTLREYHVVAIPLTIYFNKWGDHDHHAMIYILEEHAHEIDEYKDFLKGNPSDVEKVAHPAYRLIRPLVLRSCVGEEVKVHFKNKIPNRHVGIHLVSDGYDIHSDGSWVGNNPSTLVSNSPGDTITYRWSCQHEGVFVFHDAGNLSGMQDGTNSHGLFGALIVEPVGTSWKDPVTGDLIKDGLYADIIPARLGPQTPWLSSPFKYPEDADPGTLKCFREYVIFFHDEPEFIASHEGPHVMNPCEAQPDLCGNLPPLEHASHPIMPVSYRAEPMVSRQKVLWQKIKDGQLKAPVVHEEQHHSSWLFGDPATPVLKAYIGDPIRIRLIHAGVKETHVFHLHVYSWHHDALNRQSPIIDAISIGPQTAHTIMPLWGAGNRQGAVGDVIWHCHLYPHFHEGMWGMLRTFDCLHEGKSEDMYPDEVTPIEALHPLPDRQPPPPSSDDLVGFPNFIEGTYEQRSPLPPWIDESVLDAANEGLDYRVPSEKEKRRLGWLRKWVAMQDDLAAWGHINTDPVPGWMFNSFQLPENGSMPIGSSTDVNVRYDPAKINALAVQTDRFKYNEHCWHDPEGHRFLADAPLILSPHAPPNVVDESTHRGQHEFKHAACAEHSGGHDDGHGHTPGSGNVPEETTDPYGNQFEPLFLRANHGDIVTNELENRLPRGFCLSPFDESLPGCEAFSIPVDLSDPYFTGDRYKNAEHTPPMQCGLHVHLVKFDPLVADGACTGWNYLSGPRAPYWDSAVEQWRYLRMRYIWWLDEEFGVVFTHDHLFANFRQKRGLFGALIAEPQGATYHDPVNPDQQKRIGAEAVIQLPHGKAFREFCIGLGDFVPLYNRHNLPLNPPPIPGGHSDHGVVGINYRSAPIRERTLQSHDMTMHDTDAAVMELKRDPAFSFASVAWGDPDTPIFHTRPNEPIRIRVVQCSHEEQHSFQIHGMRWRRFRDDLSSPLKNQQTMGISEAFSFHIEHEYGLGDYLYKFGASDDLWMGAWGIVRVSDHDVPALPAGNLNENEQPIPAFNAETARIFEITAEGEEIHYCAIPALSDPFGLRYRLTRPTPEANAPDKDSRPLVLRCKQGEWIEVRLTNTLEAHLTPEPSAPQVPVEIFDRPVSSQVSIHGDLVHYDVTQSDGANIGRNPIQTAISTQSCTYRWYAIAEGAALLQDFADFRNHRHHGLIGALIIESADAEIPAEKSNNDHVYIQPVIFPAKKGFEEIVILIQDGLRLFHYGNLSLPMGDPAGDPGQQGPDPTDQGQKAFNYHALPIGKPDWMHYSNLLMLNDPNVQPKPLLYEVIAGRELKIHLLVGGDKPRNHTFTIHAHQWKEWPETNSPTRVSSETSLITGYAKTIHIDLNTEPGDYAFRSGALRWAVSQGLWGIIRIVNAL